MTADFLSVVLAGRLLGVPALRVREVVRLPLVTRVPGAPAMIAGLMNLRGQIVTAVDLRRRLDLPPREARAGAMAVVVEQGDDAYTLVVDSVGDVVRACADRQEPPPMTLSPLWLEVVDPVQRDEQLVLILDVDALLRLPEPARAAA